MSDHPIPPRWPVREPDPGMLPAGDDFPEPGMAREKRAPVDGTGVVRCAIAGLVLWAVLAALIIAAGRGWLS